MYMDPLSQSQNTLTYECCICLEQGTQKVYDTKDNWECESAHSGKVCPNCIEILKNDGSACPLCRAPLTQRYNNINYFYNINYNIDFNNISDDQLENIIDTNNINIISFSRHPIIQNNLVQDI